MPVAPWIQISAGNKFNYRNLSTDSVHAYDMAIALGRACRYLGRIKPGVHYSVAEHCVHMTRYAARRGASWDTLLWDMLHDGTEAFMPDFPRPWKDMPEFRPVVEFEAKLMALIARRFNLVGLTIPDEVKARDWAILYDEATQVLDAPPVDNWHQSAAPGLGVTIEFWSADEATKIWFQTLTDILQLREQAKAL